MVCADDCTKQWGGKTNSNGVVTIENVPPGFYQLTTGDHNYYLDPEPDTILIEEGKITQLGPQYWYPGSPGD